MKNKFLLFIITISCLFAVTAKINAKANENLNYGLHSVSVGEHYKHIIFADTQEELDKTNYGMYYEQYLDYLCYDETVQYKTRLTNLEDNEYEMICSYIYDEGFLKEVSYSINNHTYYLAILSNNELIDVKHNEDIVVEEITGVIGDEFHIGDSVILYGENLSNEKLEKLNIACALAPTYKENTVYEAKDIYFISDVCNPISIETLKGYISANDPTDGDVSTNIRIFNNSYIVDENLKIDKYSFDAYVNDRYGNVTYQKCYVMVVDFNPPVIVGEDLEVSYKNEKEHAELYKQFTITDNNGDCTIKVIEDTYSPNFNKPGTYTFTVEVTDLDENKSEATITIIVVDDVDPVFKIHTNELSITTLDDYSEEDILNHFVAEDEIDGDNVNMWVEDLNGYFLNTKKAGNYYFKVYAEDLSGNISEKTLTIKVVDKDFPSIEIDSTYSIIIPSGERLTKEQIKEYFNNLSFLTQNVINVESQYFDIENPEGEYDMLLTMEDGSVIQSKIIIQAQNIDYTPKGDSSFSALYIGIGIIGAMTIIAGCLAVARLKKKR